MHPPTHTHTQDSYLAALQALPEELRAALLVHQRPVLEALTAGLIQRTQLTPAAAAVATADARDLPEETRVVGHRVTGVHCGAVKFTPAAPPPAGRWAAHYALGGGGAALLPAHLPSIRGASCWRSACECAPTLPPPPHCAGCYRCGESWRAHCGTSPSC